MRTSPRLCLLLTAVAACGGEDPPTETASTAAAATVAPIVSKPAVGTLDGTPAITADGAAAYTLPLEVPAGRAGMQPSPALAYSSRAGDGIAGVGWTLSATSQIAPCGSTLRHDGELRPVQLGPRDHYCLDGARLASVASGEYRVESDPATRIVKGTSDAYGVREWTVYARDGRILHYGSTDDARIDAAAGGGFKRLAWMQSRVEDRVGNYMSFSYGRSNVGAGIEWWLERIDYAGFTPTGQGPSRQILFEYEARPSADAREQYLAGVKIRTTQRLKQITMRMLAETAPIRQYRLGYDQGALSRRSRLTTIELCDRFGVCVATRPVYTDMPADTDTNPNTNPAVTFQQPKALGLARFRDNPAVPEQRMVLVTDVDGDGRDDLVYREDSATPASDRIAIRRSLSTPLTDPTLASPEYQTYPEVGTLMPPYQTAPGASSLESLSVYDTNGDGSVDAISERESTFCCDASGAQSACSSGGERTVCTRRVAYRHPIGVWSFGAGQEITSYDPSAKADEQFLTYADFDGNLRPEALRVAPRDTLSTNHTDGLVAGSIPLQDSPAWRALQRCGGDDMCEATSTLNGGVYPQLAQVIDFDGDGATDVLLPYLADQSFVNASTFRLRYDLIQVRGSTVEATPTNLELWFDHSNDALRSVEMGCSVFADVNGDGLPDLVTITAAGPRVRLNRGDGQFETVGAAPAYLELTNLACANNHSDPGVRVVDVDQDGRSDLLMLGAGVPSRVLRSTGSGFEPMPVPTVFPGNVSKVWPIRTLDINADGLFDVLQVDDTGNLALYVQTTKRVDLLARVDNGFGAPTWGATYKPLSWTPAYMPTQGGPWLRGEPWKFYVGSTLVVTEEQLPSSASTAASPASGALVPARSHAYESGKVDTQGEGWLGFSWHTVTDLRSGRWRRTTATMGDAPVLGGRVRFPLKAMPTEELSFGPGLVTRTSTTYRTREVAGTGTYFVYPEKVTEEAYTSFDVSYPESSVPYRRTVTTTQVDNFNNPTVETVDRGGGAVTTTTRTFTNDLARWLIGLVGQEVVQSAEVAATKSRTTTYAYEDGTGRVRQIIRDASRDPTDAGPSFALCTTIAFAPAGSPSNFYKLPERVDVTPGGCTTGAQTRTTLTDYDADGTYATRTTDAEGHVTERLVEPGLGVVYQETDVQGGGQRLVTAREFDGFGRLTKEIRPDGTWTTVTRDGSAACAPYAMCTTTETSAGSKQIERADKLGQLVRTVTRGFGGDVWTDVEYDDRGRVAARLQPRYATGPTYYAARYTYDTADRVTKVCQHDATRCKTTTYGGSLTTTLDENGKKRATQLDAAGRLSWSANYPTTTAAKTTYAYGPFDATIKVTDAMGNIVTLEHDALGRQRKVIDADLGRREMDYDAFGQLVTQRDAKGQTTAMTYDRLGRLRSRSAPDGADAFVWDTADGAGQGRLASRTRGGASTAFAYDTLGRPKHETWTIDGATFDYELAYDPQGRLDTLKYPDVPGRTDRFTIKHAYTASGHLQSVKDVSTVTGKTLWTATAMDAADRVTGESLANARTTARAYAPDTGLLTRVTTPSIHDVAYAYDANGNLASRTDYRNNISASPVSRTESFTYDGANRLVSAAVTGRSTYSYTYDPIGNLTSATDQPNCTGYVYGGTGRGPHQLTSATCWGSAYPHQYDANGNETYTLAPDYREQTWTSFDKVLELGSRHGRMRYTYDADHRRAKKERVAGALSSAPTPVTPALNDALSAVWDTTYYVGDLYEKRLISGSSTIEHAFYVRAAGRTVAQVTRRGAASLDAWLYYHADF